MASRISSEIQSGMLAATAAPVLTRSPQQYFGTEARGDLDGDGRADIAFIASRTDPERGDLYYLLAALAAEEGMTGTNLIFLGDKVRPEKLSIEDGIIAISYADASRQGATTSLKMYAQVRSGALEKTSAPLTASTTASTTAATSTTAIGQ